MQRAEICRTCSHKCVQKVWVKKPILVWAQGAGGLLLTLSHHQNSAILLKTGGTFKEKRPGRISQSGGGTTDADGKMLSSHYMKKL